jgi:hypothetical protein
MIWIKNKMENNYQIIKSPRTAKLVELVGKGFEPFYKFKGSSIDFRNAPKDAGSELIYLTHSDKIDKKDVKNLAMKTFEENYNRALFIENQTLFDSYQSNSIEDWNKMKLEAEQNLENSRLKNWYNPFSKKFWDDGIEGLLRLTVEGFEVGGFGTGIYEMIAQNSDNPAWKPIFMGCFFGTMYEILRGHRKKEAKKELKSANQNIEYYDNFRKNIENSDVTIIAPEEAKQIYKDLKNSQSQGKFVKVDFDAANKELINTYQRF